MKMTRNEFLKSMAAASVAATGMGASATFSQAIAQPLIKPDHNLKLGVSIYSYGRDFLAGTATLESCMADISDYGVEGIEILGESHIPDYPNPSYEWIDKWYGWLNEYNLKPSVYDIFIDTMFYQDRYLTPKDAVGLLINDFKLANKLGFKIFRCQAPAYPLEGPVEIRAQYLSDRGKEFLELAIPYAEEYDVKLAVEMHSPTLIKCPRTYDIMELADRLNTKYLGLMPDLSIFNFRPRRGTVEGFVEQGANRKIIEYIISAYEQNLGPIKTTEQVKKMGGGEIELHYASEAGIFHQSNNDPKDLEIVAPYILHTHAKCYDMTEDLTEYSIRYPEVIQEYIRLGVGGYLSSEYEGRNPEYSVSTALRMQHGMMRNLLGM